MKTKEDIALYWMKQNSMTLQQRFWEAMEEYRLQSHTSPMSAEQVEELGYYYPLFKFFSDEHGLSLLDSQLQDVIHECKKFIEPASPSVKADGWVSVEDGLPEDGEDVLCISKSINCPVLSNYNNSAFEVKKYPCPSDRVLIAYWEDVTHWQPLPNPPKQQL